LRSRMDRAFNAGRLMLGGGRVIAGNRVRKSYGLQVQLSR
jgi:hypothetical protein